MMKVMELIMRMREEHDSSWKSPEGERGNFPNEEFFVRKTQGRLDSQSYQHSINLKIHLTRREL